jgi:hypothetical protein
MTQEVRQNHNNKEDNEKIKLEKLRKRYPERAKKYAEKNAGDWWSAPWEEVVEPYTCRGNDL